MRYEVFLFQHSTFVERYEASVTLYEGSITDAHGGDSPQFRPLVQTTSEGFPIQSVCADKAYSAEKNLRLVLVKGGMPYIDFRSNATDKNRRSGDVWKRMFHFYQYNQETFMQHYHKRSNVESTFSRKLSKVCVSGDNQPASLERRFRLCHRSDPNCSTSF